MAGKTNRFTRREFLQNTAAMVISSSTINRVLQAGSDISSQVHPHIYLTRESIPGLRSLDDVRNAAGTGHAKVLWRQMMQNASTDMNSDPLTPASIFPGRDLTAAKHKNPDWTICNAAGQRLLQGALACLVNDDDRFKPIVMEQLETLFEDRLWPEWLDQAHRRFGHPAGLRTGMLSHDVALAYDWIYHFLSEKERSFILEGLDRKGIQPYLVSLKQDPWWTHDLNNWLTVIVGGLGIVGMALGDDHPQSQKLIEYSIPKMEEYLSIYGPDGEFNESVAYANATRLPAAYYLARYYWSKGGENRLARRPFPQTCKWTMYFTLPPGRVAAFGDSKTKHPVEVRHFSAIAAATQNGILQWFYLNHAPAEASPMQFLWFDATLKPVNPEGELPLGKAFRAHGANFSSRTSWDPRMTECVVYGKAGREENHEHNDMGQVCIDGYGERLIVDLGSPSSYPADFFDEGRWHYYNASIKGHNILMIGNREMQTIKRDRGQRHDQAFYEMQGKILAAQFDNKRGCFWRIDTTRAYAGARSIRRTVVHLLPGIIAVLDEAELENPEDISLRWHTASRSIPDDVGNFLVFGKTAHLAGRIVNLGQDIITISQESHNYAPPYHLDRLGEPLQQRHESYIEARLKATQCRLLSLFAVSGPESKHTLWQPGGDSWFIDSAQGIVEVKVTDDRLWMSNSQNDLEWSVDLNI